MLNDCVQTGSLNDESIKCTERNGVTDTDTVYATADANEKESYLSENLKIDDIVQSVVLRSQRYPSG